jgi:hypothetical protein
LLLPRKGFEEQAQSLLVGVTDAGLCSKHALEIGSGAAPEAP